MASTATCGQSLRARSTFIIGFMKQYVSERGLTAGVYSFCYLAHVAS